MFAYVSCILKVSCRDQLLYSYDVEEVIKRLIIRLDFVGLVW